MLNTSGGVTTLSGANFGATPPTSNGTIDFDSYNRTVTVGGTPCEVLSWNDSLIECDVAPGFVKVRVSPAVH